MKLVLNDMQTDINMPFVLKVDINELDLTQRLSREKEFLKLYLNYHLKNLEKLMKKKDTCPLTRI